MSNINKIADLISKKGGNPLKELLYNKIQNSVDIGDYLRNNKIPRENVGSLKVKTLEDAINFGKMGANNYAHNLANFIKDPSSIKDVLNKITDNPKYPQTYLSKKRFNEAKAGTSASVLLAALLSKLMSKEGEDEEEFETFENI